MSPGAPGMVTVGVEAKFAASVQDSYMSAG